jgi:uncharacterized membrane protein
MAPITESIEIDSPPEQVFAYLDDLSRHGEWQEDIQQVTLLTEGPTRVGSRARDRRKMPLGTQEITYEITEHDPPRKASFKGVDGPVRVEGTVTVEPLDDGSRSRLTLTIDFHGHGLGKLILPLAKSQARKSVPRDQRKLKENLEAGKA